LTQPRPIASAGALFDMSGFAVDGVSVFSPLGDAAGAAVSSSGSLYISVISPNQDFGTNLDYPFLTVTMDVPAGEQTGWTFPLQLGASTVVGPDGPLTFTDPKPGTLTIGGSISIRGVYPGGGTFPAGTTVVVRGAGFQPGTKLSTKMNISNPVYISPTEMHFTLQQQTTLDTQPIQAVNPGGSQVTFYTYLRGALIAPPSRALLRNTEPIFQTVTHGVATVGPLPATSPGQFTALALQNPNPGPVSVTFFAPQTGAASTIVLQSGQRIMDDLQVLINAALNPGDTVQVNATSAIQIVGLEGDENSGSVTPFLPAF